jgi:hypothetical protein
VTCVTRNSALFDTFNRCDVAGFERFFTEDLEFYHDYNGLATPRSKNIEIIDGGSWKISRVLSFDHLK